jgi:hypothetical protein
MDTFLTLLIISLVTALVTQIVKRVKWIKKMGDYGVQLLVLFFAIIIAVAEYGFNLLPPEAHQTVVYVWGLTIAWYEIVIKKFTVKG